MDGGNSFLVGHHDSKRNEPISPALAQHAHSANYDMLTFPITTSHFHSRVLAELSATFSRASAAQNGLHPEDNSTVQIDALTPADTNLTPDESVGSIIGVTSTWTDLGSSDPIVADISRQVLKLELAYAAFCGVSYIIVPGPRQSSSCDVAAFARAILEGLNQGPYMQLYMWIDMAPNASNITEQVGDIATFARHEFVQANENTIDASDAFFTWQAWDTVRTICKYSTRLCLALSIPKALPQAALLTRWYSEPVRILTIDSSAFRPNAKGYPALPSQHQDYITKLMRLKAQPWIILCNVTPLPRSLSMPGEKTDADFPLLNDVQPKATKGHDDPHIQYIRHLQTKQSKITPMDQFGAGYQDYLQAPLQPLTVNLESITYEVFEKDPIKYEWYERAVARALHDWIEQGKPTSNPDGRVVVAVVGAGRGPLVNRALKAAEDVGVEIDMWALEKNPNAFVLLQRHNDTKWDQQVSLVRSDMRTWLGPSTNKNLADISRIYNVDFDEFESSKADLQAPHPPEINNVGSYRNSTSQLNRYKIDILISELLGSFADNELSPECLDGVQHLLNPVHGISIPASYTAHFTPVAAPKLHADISLSMVNVNPHAAEIPYVVMLDQIDFLSTQPLGEESTNNSSPSKPRSFTTLFTGSSDPRQSSASTTSTAATKLSTSLPKPIIHTAWSFRHPNPSLPNLVVSSASPTNTHNGRYCRFSFPIAHPGTCHGLGGYFETVLYPGVELSTNPLTMDSKSEGMISWFPIFFPFKSPIFLPERSLVDVSMWRQTDDRRVWYEWMLEVFTVIGESNGKERRIKVGSTTLHSSEKEACLM